MRVAVLTWTDRRAGGVETYLEHVMAELAALGDTLSLWHEVSEPADRPAMALPRATDAARCDGDALARWQPDVLLSNGLSRPDREATLHQTAPVVFVAHNYYGTCISGKKSWASDPRQPCHRTFGWQCLAHYYPHRCGGLNPLTMTRLYGDARTRLDTIRRCQRVVTLSSHMRNEYIAHGLAANQVAVVPYGPPAPARKVTRSPQPADGFRLVCIGRLEKLKGVDLLLDALPSVRQQVGRPIELAIVGEGPERRALTEYAERLKAVEGLTVTFAGWQPPDARDQRLADADVFVLPSVWPEPFGIVGLEAGHLGLPAVAFDVGGVSDWLIDGETGRLATGAIPSSASLATALAECLLSPNRAEMGARAAARAAERTPRRHAALLHDVLAAAAGQKRGPIAQAG